MRGALELANYLDKVAEDQLRLEAALASKLSQDQSTSAAKLSEEKPTLIEKFASYYRKQTGEDLPEEMKAKLTDPGIAEIVAKLADQSGGERTPLGSAEELPSARPSEVQNGIARTDRAKAAWDNFGNFLQSNHP